MKYPKLILLCCASREHACALQFILTSRGAYEAHIAPAPENALRMLARNPYDLLLCELTATSAAGNELAGQAKRIARTPVVIFSSDSNRYERASNADCFIPEQFCNSEEILARIAEFCLRGFQGGRRSA